MRMEHHIQTIINAKILENDKPIAFSSIKINPVADSNLANSYLRRILSDYNVKYNNLIEIINLEIENFWKKDSDTKNVGKLLIDDIASSDNAIDSIIYIYFDGSNPGIATFLESVGFSNITDAIIDSSGVRTIMLYTESNIGRDVYNIIQNIKILFNSINEIESKIKEESI